MYCFFRELAELLDVPTLRWVDSSLHFLLLFTCRGKGGGGHGQQKTEQPELGMKAYMIW